MTTKGIVWHVQALTTYLTKLRVKMSHQEKENGGKAEDILVGICKASVQCLQPCKCTPMSPAVEFALCTVFSRDPLHGWARRIPSSV